MNATAQPRVGEAPPKPRVRTTVAQSAHQYGNSLDSIDDGGERGNYPEFNGNVTTVVIRGFWRPADISPKNQGFHYNQNAETYILVGETLSKGMIELQTGSK